MVSYGNACGRWKHIVRSWFCRHQKIAEEWVGGIGIVSVTCAHCYKIIWRLEPRKIPKQKRYHALMYEQNKQRKYPGQVAHIWCPDIEEEPAGLFNKTTCPKTPEHWFEEEPTYAAELYALEIHPYGTPTKLYKIKMKDEQGLEHIRLVEVNQDHWVRHMEDKLNE